MDPKPKRPWVTDPTWQLHTRLKLAKGLLRALHRRMSEYSKHRAFVKWATGTATTVAPPRTQYATDALEAIKQGAR
eukprot:8137232-Alexandrium_andersonii.AAC.1